MAQTPSKPRKTSLGKTGFRLSVGKATTWLPFVALIICLSMFAMAAVALFTVGADPESPPSAVVTSISAQGYQGLRRLLVARGHATATNRFEDTAGTESRLTRGDVEIITLNGASGLVGPGFVRRHVRNDEASSSASESASASADSSVAEDEPETFGDPPDKRHADHVLYRPLGRVVIVVAPKWYATPARLNPRWAQDAQLLPPQIIEAMLPVLSPMTETPSPPRADADRSGASDSASASSAAPEPQAPQGKGVYDDGDTVITYDKVTYDIRRSHTSGVLELHAAPGQNLFPATLKVGRIGDLQSITGPNLTPVLLGPNGEALLSRVTVTDGRPQPKAPVYLVSDPDLLNNQILADPQKVAAAMALIDALSPPARRPASVVFNLTFNGMAFDHDLLHALSRPPFVAVPLNLLILGLGLMWAAFSRFGPPQLAGEGAALGRGVRILADNAARLMAIAVKETKLGPAYAQLMRDEVLRRRGYRPATTHESLDELADRIGQMHGASETYSDLKARAANILTVHQLIDLTQKLHLWKTEIERANI